MKTIFKSVLLPVMLIGLAGCSTTVKQVVNTKNAPAAIGPYSQAIKVGNTLYLSGQIPLDPQGQVNTGSIEEQTKQVLENIKSVLAANNMTMNDVVNTTVYLSNLADFSKMNTVYANYFGDKPPARATVQVAKLPREVAIEISATAVK